MLLRCRCRSFSYSQELTIWRNHSFASIAGTQRSGMSTNDITKTHDQNVMKVLQKNVCNPVLWIITELMSSSFTLHSIERTWVLAPKFAWCTGLYSQSKDESKDERISHFLTAMPSISIRGHNISANNCFGSITQRVLFWYSFRNIFS